MVMMIQQGASGSLMEEGDWLLLLHKQCLLFILYLYIPFQIMPLFSEILDLSKHQLYFWKLAESAIGMGNHLDEW